MTTGPAHWEKLTVARALDNQLYVATVSPARDENASYVAWGHSTCVNPWYGISYMYNVHSVLAEMLHFIIGGETSCTCSLPILYCDNNALQNVFLRYESILFFS